MHVPEASRPVLCHLDLDGAGGGTAGAAAGIGGEQPGRAQALHGEGAQGERDGLSDQCSLHFSSFFDVPSTIFARCLAI